MSATLMFRIRFDEDYLRLVAYEQALWEIVAHEQDAAWDWTTQDAAELAQQVLAMRFDVLEPRRVPESTNEPRA